MPGRAADGQRFQCPRPGLLRLLLGLVLAGSACVSCGGSTEREIPIVTVDCGRVDFETPPLGSVERGPSAHAYTDEATGVTFEAVPFDPDDHPAVGLVGGVQICASARGPSQKLGTAEDVDGAPGFAIFPILATFPAILAEPASVSVEMVVYTGNRSTARLALLDTDGNEVATAAADPDFAMWPCPGSYASEGVVRLLATADVPVRYARMEVPRVDGIGFVWLLDDFAFSGGPSSDAGNCHDLDTQIFPDRLCHGNPGPDQLVQYVCVERPDSIASCAECDLVCMQQMTLQRISQEQACLGYPDELLCGPDPQYENSCCYVVLANEHGQCPI